MGGIILSTQTQSSDKLWHLFVEKGVVPGQGLRPEVARSWQRSRGIDPWQIKLDVLPDSNLKARRKRYSDLIEVANPIMKDICSLGEQNFVLLCDTEGYVLDTISNMEYPQPLGLRLSEETLGTNAIGIALVEGSAIELKGYEHYSSKYHTFSCAAAPIHDHDGSIIGVIDISNPFGDLPTNVLKMLGLGVKLVENQLCYRAEKLELQKIRCNCSSIVDVFQDCLLLVDTSGEIINVNNNFLQLVGEKNKQVFIGNHLRDYIGAGEPGFDSLLSSGTNISTCQINFTLGNKIIKCSLLEKHTINVPEGRKQIVLMFNNDNKIELTRQAVVPIRGSLLSNFDHLIGDSEKWINIKSLAHKAAPTASNVLIEGESGTGKELLAQAIHNASGRKGAFIAINCGSIPRELLQSELYGYEDGSFTGARKGGSMGKLEMAHGGTVFLDEIGEMPFDMQVSLLRFLQDRTLIRVGGSQPRKIDLRVIAATNRNLKEEMLKGNFRKDLYYRLSVINIELPPLRERKEDIPLIANYLVNELCEHHNRQPMYIADDAMKVLSKYDWPGNARELSNIMEHAVIFTEGNIISAQDLPGSIFESGTVELNTSGKLEEYEKTAIINSLRQYEGNISQAAKALGVARNTLYRKLKKFGIDTDLSSWQNSLGD